MFVLLKINTKSKKTKTNKQKQLYWCYLQKLCKE